MPPKIGRIGSPVSPPLLADAGVAGDRARGRLLLPCKRSVRVLGSGFPRSGGGFGGGGGIVDDVREAGKGGSPVRAFRGGLHPRLRKEISPGFPVIESLRGGCAHLA